MSGSKLRLRLPKIGEEMRDGTIYCGVSPHTNLPFYLEYTSHTIGMPWPFSLTMARRLNVHGHQDWRLPTLDELTMIFENREDIGGFYQHGFYWAAAPHYLQSGWAMNFKSGHAAMMRKSMDCFFMCVRGQDPYRQ